MEQTRSGVIVGRIWFHFPFGDFPEVGWSDLVLPLLEALAQAVRVLEQGAAESRVVFFEGPFELRLQQTIPGVAQVRAIRSESDEWREDGTEVSLTGLRRHVAQAIKVTVEACRELGWSGGEIEGLARQGERLTKDDENDAST